ncbi:MAG: hypothetical protein ACI85O_002249 [Saprospiraceae bacterium]|jgi:hypothetical protein
MRNYPIILTLFTCCLCVFITTSCLDDEQVALPIELNATVEIVDSTVVLTNNDNINITNALVVLEKPTGDSLNGAPLALPYAIEGYNLNMGLTDSIPLSNFKRDNNTESYPTQVVPLLFRLDFENGNTTGFIEKRF